MRGKGIAAAVAALGMFGAAAGAAAEARPLTLDRCVDLALRSAPRLEVSAADHAAARARAAGASARRFPTLAFSGSYQYTSEVMEKEIAVGFGFAPIALSFGDEHRSEIGLGITVPIYTGGELGGIARAERAGARAAERTGEAIRLDLIRETRAAFFTALGREAGVEAAALAAARLERRAEELAEAVRIGAASEEDRLRADAGLGEARRRFYRAEASRDSAALVLGRLVGRPGEAVRPAGDLERSILGGKDLSPERIAARPELAALDAGRERWEATAAALGGRFLPRIVGDLRARYGRPGVDVFENDWMEYGTASLVLDWTLWDFGARSEARREAEAAARRVSAERRDREERFLAAHGSAEAVLRAARREEEEAERTEALTRRILEMTRERRAEAQATESEYLDAEEDLAAAEVALALARARVRLAETALLWTVGE